MQKLTDKLINSLVFSKQKQATIIRDTELRGFGIRVTSGGSSFIVEARISGKSRRITIGRAELYSVEEARKEAIQLLAKMTSGTDPVEEKKKQQASAITLGEVLDHYLTVQRLKPTTRNGYQHNITFSFRDWLGKPLTEITPAMIFARHKELPRPNKFGTSGQCCANHAVKKLGALMNFAINNLGVEMANPVQIMNKNRAWYRVNRVHAVIADHQLPTYWKALQSIKREKVRDFYLLLLLTGLRRGEALTLKWEQIDFEGRTLTIPATVAKNHCEHVLPLSDVLLALLLKRKSQSDSPWVFPNIKGTMHMAHQTYSSGMIGKELGSLFSPHACRRSFVTLASRLGIPHHIVKKLVNHVQVVDVASTYVILGIECLREPMQQITDKFMELMQVNQEEYNQTLPAGLKRTVKPPTLAEVLREYLLSRKLRISTQTNYEKCIRVDFGDWLPRPVTEITQAMVEERKRELSSRKKHFTVNSSLNFLRSLFHFAAKNYETPSGRPLIEKNPVQCVTRYSEAAFRRTHIEDLPGWYSAVMQLRANVFRDYLLFCLFSGLRKREAMTLQWADVDMDNRTISIRAEAAKNGHGYLLPISSFLFQLLRRRQEQAADSPYIFPGRFGVGHMRSAQRAIEEVSRVSGNAFIMPDIRRTFIYVAMKAGVPQHLIKKLLNQCAGYDFQFDRSFDQGFDALIASMEQVSSNLQQWIPDYEQSPNKCC